MEFLAKIFVNNYNRMVKEWKTMPMPEFKSKMSALVRHAGVLRDITHNPQVFDKEFNAYKTVARDLGLEISDKKDE